MFENYFEPKYDEFSMSNAFGIKDYDFSRNIPTHFEQNLSSCLQQTFGEKEEQNNIKVEENEFNELNNTFSVLNGHQQSEEDFNLKLFNPLNSVKVNDMDVKIFDDLGKDKKMNEKKKEKSFQVSNLKKTNNISIKCEQFNQINVKAFSENISQRTQRIDYGKKYFKTNFSSFLKKYANRLIQKSCLPKNLKLKISSPNSLSFTSNVKDSDNLAFLSFSVQEIFCYYKESNKCQNSL